MLGDDGDDGDDVVAQTQATYDRVAVDYQRRTQEPPESFTGFRAVFSAAAEGLVLDLGCGPGRDLGWLRDRGHEAFGVDLSEGMLALARAQDLPVVRGDVRCPPVGPASVQAIWSSAALLHVPREDVPRTLAAWHSLLVPGGRLGLSTSLGGDEGWELVPYAGPDPQGGDLHRWFVHHTVEGLTTLLRGAGFTVLSTESRPGGREWLMVHAVA